MGGSTLKRIENIGKQGDLRALRRNSYNPPSLSLADLLNHKARLERDGKPEDKERLKRALKIPSIAQFFKL